jgi:hypothetical protein
LQEWPLVNFAHRAIGFDQTFFRDIKQALSVAQGISIAPDKTFALWLQG